jgi:DNA-binding FrmR family transcriptional regulator
MVTRLLDLVITVDQLDQTILLQDLVTQQGHVLEIEFMLEEGITLVVTTDIMDQLATTTHMVTTLAIILIAHTDTLLDVQHLDTLTEDTTEQVTTLAG